MELRPLSEKFYRALDLALSAHKNQKRKPFENYSVHLIEVALALIGLGPELPEYVIWAGLLHDAIEDGHITYDQIAEEFGVETADLVAEVTDDPRLTRKQQKEYQITSFAGKTYYGKVLKLADRFSNAVGMTGKLQRTEKYREHTMRLLGAVKAWGETLSQDSLYASSNNVKHKFVFILAERIASAMKEQDRILGAQSDPRLKPGQMW